MSRRHLARVTFPGSTNPASSRRSGGSSDARSTATPGSITSPGGSPAPTRCSRNSWRGFRGAAASCTCTTAWWTNPGLPGGGPTTTMRPPSRCHSSRTRRGRSHAVTGARSTRSASISTAMGANSVVWHGDRIRHAQEAPLVAIVSVGSPRPFFLRRRGGGPSLPFLLGQGDLLVMGGDCQHDWEHTVPKVAVAGPRISITFRHGAPPPTALDHPSGRGARRPRGAEDRHRAATETARTAGTMRVGFGCASIRPRRRRRDRLGGGRWRCGGSGRHDRPDRVGTGRRVRRALRPPPGRMLHPVVRGRVRVYCGPMLSHVVVVGASLAGVRPPRRCGRTASKGASLSSVTSHACPTTVLHCRRRCSPASGSLIGSCLRKPEEFGALELDLRLGVRAERLDGPTVSGCRRRLEARLRRAHRRDRRAPPPAARPARPPGVFDAADAGRLAGVARRARASPARSSSSAPASSARRWRQRHAGGARGHDRGGAAGSARRAAWGPRWVARAPRSTSTMASTCGSAWESRAWTERHGSNGSVCRMGQPSRRTSSSSASAWLR